MRLTIYRTYQQDKQTLGEMQIEDFTCFSLELPWKNNEVRKSCIPPGIYRVVKHTSPKFGKCFWVKDVPNRSAILIHPGNYFKHTLGCILPATEQRDINGDGYIDNVSSVKAMDKLLEFDITELEIIEI